MDNIKRLIIVGYSVSVLIAVLIVPWKSTRQLENGYLANISYGYSFIFLPPMQYISVIDYGFVILELIAITSVAAVCYLLRDKLFKIASLLTLKL